MPDIILKRKVFEWPNGTLKIELQEDPDSNISRVYIRWRRTNGPVQEMDGAWSEKKRMAEIFDEHVTEFMVMTYCPAWIDKKSISGTPLG